MADDLSLPANTAPYPLYERETEILGTHPVTVIDNVINAVNDCACDAADALETFLCREATLEGNTEEARAGVDAFLTALQGKIDENFDKFELYTLKNVFAVPREVVLPSQVRGGICDTGLKAVSEDDAKNADAEIEALRARIRAANHANVLLRQEHAVRAKHLDMFNEHRELLTTLEQMFTTAQSHNMPEAFQTAIAAANDLREKMRHDSQHVQTTLAQATSGAPTASSMMSRYMEDNQNMDTPMDVVKTFAAGLTA